jgi:hypothetical protein
MLAVIVTAIATWVMILIMDVVPIGGWLLEGTLAVAIGALIGLSVPWYLARQRRNRR